jgi:hypothetical protein
VGRRGPRWRSWWCTSGAEDARYEASAPQAWHWRERSAGFITRPASIQAAQSPDLFKQELAKTGSASSSASTSGAELELELPLQRRSQWGPTPKPGRFTPHIWSPRACSSEAPPKGRTSKPVVCDEPWPKWHRPADHYRFSHKHSRSQATSFSAPARASSYPSPWQPPNGRRRQE